MLITARLKTQELTPNVPAGILADYLDDFGFEVEAAALRVGDLYVSDLFYNHKHKYYYKLYGYGDGNGGLTQIRYNGRGGLVFSELSLVGSSNGNGDGTGHGTSSGGYGNGNGGCGIGYITGLNQRWINSG